MGKEWRKQPDFSVRLVCMADLLYEYCARLARNYMQIKIGVRDQESEIRVQGLGIRGQQWGSCFVRRGGGCRVDKPDSRDRVHRSIDIPGPQKRGTGGNFIFG